MDNMRDAITAKNRASLREPATTEVFCPSCDESLIFAMQNKEHQFSIGLSTILECLVLAEKEGHVPPLPPKWWIALSVRYHTVARIYQHICNQKD